MKRSPGLLAATVLLSAACANSWYGSVSNNWEERGRAGYDLPIRFVADTSATTADTTGCLITLYDPRDRHPLRLTQSGRTGSGHSRGDYDVIPAGRYGVRSGEFLRIDCETGRALGIVPEPKPDSP